MSESLFLKLTQGGMSEAQVRALLSWQLNLDETKIDCNLVEECLRFLNPGEQGIGQERKDALRAGVMGHTVTRRHASVVHHRRRPGKALVLAALLVLMLAMAAGAVAYMIARGTLNFNEGFGWGTPITHQEGAQEMVVSGALAHQDMEHVTIDVLEAAYDGSELRIVYRVTSKVGGAHEDGDVYFIPGAAEDGVHGCDYVTINGQDAYFYDTYEVMGEAENEVLYYLQTNLRAWNVDVSGAETLEIGLPMLGEAQRDEPREMIEFTIPASVPQELVRGAGLTGASAGGREVSLEQAAFTPVSGYVQLRVKGMTEKALQNDARGYGYALDHSDEEIPGSRLEGMKIANEDELIVGWAIMPPTQGWPECMTLVFEMAHEPDWTIEIEVK